MRKKYKPLKQMSATERMDFAIDYVAENFPWLSKEEESLMIRCVMGAVKWAGEN